MTGPGEIEPELTEPTPRPLSLSPGTRVVRWLIPSLFLGVLGLVWMAVALSQHELTRFLREGRTTDAQVTSKHRAEGKASEAYRLDYAYTVDGRRLHGSSYVSEQLYQHTPQGGSLTISYLASNPQIQRSGTVDAAQVAADARAGNSILWVIGVIFAIVAGWVERYFRRMQSLLRNGAAVRAEILTSSKPLIWRSLPPSITFEYPTSGGERVRRTLRVRADIAEALVRQPHATVLYNPRHPRECQLYRSFEAQGE